MARTFIGRLILGLEDNMSGKAKKAAENVNRSLSSIEKNAARLGNTPWGGNFQKQLEKLALSKGEMKAVNKSWNSLERNIRDKNLSKALAKSDIRNWRMATLGHFTQVRAGMKSMEREAGRVGKGIQAALRPAYAIMGGYSLTYLGAAAARKGFTAASERQRTKYRYDLANVPQKDTDALDQESGRLAGKYGVIPKNDIFELGKTAWALMGGNADRAKGLLEPIMQSFVNDVTAVGVDKAGENLSSFLKAMDNLNINEGADGGVGNISKIMEGWARAKQVEGKDIDIGDILAVAQRAKAAKYGLSDRFLEMLLPALIQDQGAGPLGDALSGAYQNLVTPIGLGKQKSYLMRQQALGLRTKENSLVQRDLFSTNPYEWANQVLKPLLEKAGTDTNNPADLSEAVKKLMSNSKAAAAIVGFITAAPQIDKNAANYEKAVGFGDAENARAKDPFAAYADLKSAFSDLSAAAGEYIMPVIVPGLNSMANVIRTIGDGLATMPDEAKMALAAGGVGAVGLGGYGAAKAVYGLITAGTNLNAAAVALQEAAAMQMGGDVPGKKGVGGGGWSWLAGAAAFAKTLGIGGGMVGAATALDETPGGTMAAKVKNQEKYRKGLQRMFGINEIDDIHQGQRMPGSGPGPSALKRFLMGDAAKEGFSFKGSMGIDAGITGLKTDARAAGDEIKASLSPTAKPEVDTSSIDTAISKAQQLKGLLNGIAASATAANNSVDREMRRSMSDYGVTP